MNGHAFPTAIAFMRRLRAGLDSGLELPEALTRGATALPRDARETLDRILDRLEGDYAEDEWGFDEDFAELVEPFFAFLYETWWRVQVLGAERVPAHGRALLTANHAGILPWDATMISMALLREHPLPRYPRFLVLNWAFDLPWISGGMRKVGGVVASPFNAMRLLEQDHLVAVFPEGVKGTGKPYSERYRLQRFGRGGFVEIALRTGAPIVPVAVVGSEEIYPKLADLPAVARLIGAPYFPVTPTFPLLGPLGVVPLPSKWRIEFLEPIETASYGPEAAEDRALVLELSERVRDGDPAGSVREPRTQGARLHLTARFGRYVKLMRYIAVLLAALALSLLPGTALAAPGDPWVAYVANSVVTKQSAPAPVILRADPATGGSPRSRATARRATSSATLRHRGRGRRQPARGGHGRVRHQHRPHAGRAHHPRRPGHGPAVDRQLGQPAGRPGGPDDRP